MKLIINGSKHSAAGALELFEAAKQTSAVSVVNRSPSDSRPTWVATGDLLALINVFNMFSAETDQLFINMVIVDGENLLAAREYTR